MAAVAVRCFSYAGIIAVPWAANNQLATNGEYVFQDPYVASAVLSVDTTPAQTTSTALSPIGTRVLRVEVQRGYVMHYEITKGNATPVIATTASPTIDGKETLDFGPGYTISFMQAVSEA